MKLTGKTIAILIAEGVEDLEYYIPLMRLLEEGATVLTAAIVKSHRATGSLGIKDDLINAGATWVDEPAFRDGNQVWGRVVADIPAFCRELVSDLA